MPTQSTSHIEDLSPTEVELLTQLLSLPPSQSPSSSWFREQSRRLSQFPSSLQKPSSLVPRLAMALPFTSPQAELCKTHKPLNPHLIRRIFLQVSAESTTRMTRLAENKYLPHDLAEFVNRLRIMNSIWMSPGLYRIAFNAMPSDTRFECIPSGCEACILACIGGNHRILSDLRASILGRKKKHQPKPALFGLIEAWIDWTGRGDVIRTESYALAKDIRHCRRQMQKARRQKRRNLANGIIDGESIKDSEALIDECDSSQKDKEEHDFEGSIIDYYASLMSTTNLIPNAETAQGMHPAFRKSIMFDAETGTFYKDPEPPSSTIYSESLYSTSDLYAASSKRASAADSKAGTADEHAISYRELVGIVKDDERKGDY